VIGCGSSYLLDQAATRLLNRFKTAAPQPIRRLR
jgi:hypothetical protein